MPLTSVRVGDVDLLRQVPVVTFPVGPYAKRRCWKCDEPIGSSPFVVHVTRAGESVEHAKCPVLVKGNRG